MDMMTRATGERASGAALAGAIVAVARRGDRAAFAILFEHFAPRVKSYMMRLGAEPEAAEELAQEALFIVWRRAAGFDPARAAASTWIFTIARNLRFDVLRRDKRSARDGPIFAAEIQPAEPLRPDESLRAAENQARVARALEELPADQAAVVRLAYFSDQAHSEIAAGLGLPLGTVKSRLRLAMTRLRAALGDEP